MKEEVVGCKEERMGMERSKEAVRGNGESKWRRTIQRRRSLPAWRP